MIRVPSFLFFIALLCGLWPSSATGDVLPLPPLLRLLQTSRIGCVSSDSTEPDISSSERDDGSSLPSAGPFQTAEGKGDQSDDVKIIARFHEKTEDRIFATGAVEIHYRNVILMADRVEYFPETKDVIAEGNVVVQLSDELIQAEKMVFNLGTEQGHVEKASGMIQPSILFHAETAERTAPNFFTLRRADATACTQPVPRWKFTFRRANIKKDDYLQMWNAFLRIKNVPVFYVPYLKYPLKKKRSTGFLWPRIGFSGEKGFQFTESFFWVIARNMDATAHMDYYSALGLGTGLEFRYLFREETSGQANLYYFMPRKKGGGTNLSPSSIIRIKHIQTLPAGFRLVANVDYQTSFDFLREFDNDFRRAVISNRNSQVYLSRSWTRFNLSARASLFETYFAELNDAIVSAYLPQINFNIINVKLFPPLLFSLKTALNAWQYGWRSEYEENTQRRSSSLAVSPTISLPITGIPWMTVNAAVSANLVTYGQSIDPESGQIVDESLTTHNVVASLEVSGPVFHKVYYGRDGRPLYKHIIEPYANYSYESPIGQAERVVTPYGLFRNHQLNFGITNRFLVKKEDTSQEIMTLGLSQTYYFSPEDSPLKEFLVDGKIPHFSELTGYFRFYPLSEYNVDVALGFNPYYKEFSTLRVSANAGSKEGGRFLSLRWFRSMNSWMAGVDPQLKELYNRHQVSLYGGFPIPRLSLDLTADIDYNLKEKRILYTAAQAVYHLQCLDLLFEIRVFYFRERPETQFKFSVGLGNIGGASDFLAGLGFGENKR